MVYRAHDSRLERTVALKFLAPQRVSDEEARRRFIHEAKAAVALDYPNICMVYEIDKAAGESALEGTKQQDQAGEPPRLRLPQRGALRGSLLPLRCPAAAADGNVITLGGGRRSRPYLHVVSWNAPFQN